LLHTETEGGRQLTDREIAGTVMNLMIAGFHTTADSGGSFLVRLAEDPELQASLRHDPTAIPRSIEEHLRMVPAVPQLTRVCKERTELNGYTLNPGDRVVFVLAAANRDAQEFDRPDDYLLNRPRNRHLTFGVGIHRCIGSHFARLTLRVVFEQLLHRFSTIQIAPGEHVRWKSVPPKLWYTLETIPVTLEPLPPARSQQ
jgi:cytochrome P450